MRVLTWNVWGLRAGTRPVAAVLRAARVDVACLQECPRGPLAGVRTRILARAAGMRLVGRAAGVALLVGAGIDVDDVATAREPRRWRGWWWTYPRASVSARLREAGSAGGGSAVVAVVVHLDVDEAARLRHARRLLAEHGDKERWFLAGDLNAAPGDPARDLLARDLHDPGTVPTYPAGRARPPRRRIDAVLVRGLEPAATQVPRAQAGDGRGRRGRPLSDHLPVLVTLTPPSAR